MVGDPDPRDKRGDHRSRRIVGRINDGGRNGGDPVWSLPGWLEFSLAAWLRLSGRVIVRVCRGKAAARHTRLFSLYTVGPPSIA